jgi:hypothetical protein
METVDTNSWEDFEQKLKQGARGKRKPLHGISSPLQSDELTGSVVHWRNTLICFHADTLRLRLLFGFSSQS